MEGNKIVLFSSILVKVLIQKNKEMKQTMSEKITETLNHKDLILSQIST